MHHYSRGKIKKEDLASNLYWIEDYLTRTASVVHQNVFVLGVVQDIQFCGTRYSTAFCTLYMYCCCFEWFLLLQASSNCSSTVAGCVYPLPRTQVLLFSARSTALTSCCVLIGRMRKYTGIKYYVCQSCPN